MIIFGWGHTTEKDSAEIKKHKKKDLNKIFAFVIAGATLFFITFNPMAISITAFIFFFMTTNYFFKYRKHRLASK